MSEERFSFRQLGRIFKNGIIAQNPTLVLLLGMCPTMAITTTLQNGIGMGLASTAVLICSNAVISALRKLIPPQIRIAAFVVIIAGFVSSVDLALQAYLPSLSESLGVFIPLIVVNCIILGRAEAFASKNPVLQSACDGLGMGLGFTSALLAMSFVRELLGSGSLWGYQLIPGYIPLQIFTQPAGGFLTLGFLIAAVQFFVLRRKKKKGGAQA